MAFDLAHTGRLHNQPRLLPHIDRGNLTLERSAVLTAIYYQGAGIPFLRPLAALDFAGNYGSLANALQRTVYDLLTDHEIEPLVVCTLLREAAGTVELYFEHTGAGRLEAVVSSSRRYSLDQYALPAGGGIGVAH